MQKIEQRIENLETKHGAEKPLFDEIVIGYIRPGDMACVGEPRYNRDTGEWDYTQLIADDEGARP